MHKVTRYVKKISLKDYAVQMLYIANVFFLRIQKHKVKINCPRNYNF